VDTAGWAEPVLGNTPDHDRMAAAYRHAVASRRPLVTTNYVLSEVVALLTARSRASRPQLLALMAAIRTLPRLRIVHVDLALDAAAWSLLEQASDKQWSLVDAASLVVMRRLGIEQAFTSDHHFAQAGFMCVPAPSLY